MIPMREWTRTTGMRMALLALAVAGVLCIVTLVRATRIEPVTPAPATVSIVAGALDAPAAVPAVNVDVAFGADLFAPERKPPASRYRMPGEAAPKSVEEPPKPIVLGTALAADGTSFATCQYQSARLLMVRVGDKVGDYVVKSIERGRVVFATPAGKTFEVLAPRAGS